MSKVLRRDVVRGTGSSTRSLCLTPSRSASHSIENCALTPPWTRPNLGSATGSDQRFVVSAIEAIELRNRGHRRLIVLWSNVTRVNRGERTIRGVDRRVRILWGRVSRLIWAGRRVLWVGRGVCVAIDLMQLPFVSVVGRRMYYISILARFG